MPKRTVETPHCKTLKAIVAEQQKQIDAFTVGLQKVSAQLEATKPSQQTVLNKQ
jgi:hypothetical protein